MKFSGSLSEADKEKAWYELVGVPFDGNASRRGAREGPNAIRNASQRLETFLWDSKLELSDLLYYDRGDRALELFTKSQGEEIEDFELTGKKKIFIGGDHSISYPIVNHFFEHGEVARVIVIDAHADFRDSYKNNRFSNACVMRRIAELIGFENIIEIGVRSSSEEEYLVLKDNDIRQYDMKPVEEKGLEWLLSEISEGEEKTYLSIDIDVLDPGIAPGVEHPEPCGMSLETLLPLIRGIIASEKVVAADLVEVNPRLDNANGITSLNAARIIFEILAGYGARDRCY